MSPLLLSCANQIHSETIDHQWVCLWGAGSPFLPRQNNFEPIDSQVFCGGGSRLCRQQHTFRRLTPQDTHHTSTSDLSSYAAIFRLWTPENPLTYPSGPPLYTRWCSTGGVPLLSATRFTPHIPMGQTHTPDTNPETIDH